MTNATYLELTSSLLKRLLKLFYDDETKVSGKPENNLEVVIKWQLINGKETVLTVVLTKINESQVLVNLLYSDGSTNTAVLDWNDMELDLGAINLPIETESVPQEIVDKFNERLYSLINKKRLQSLFNVPLRDMEQGGERKVPKLPSQDVAIPVKQDPPSRARPSDMPDFEDEYEMKSSGETTQPFLGFPSIGDRDLNPPGISNHPRMRPYLDHSVPDNDGGMYPSPNHPLFGSGHSGNTSRLGVPPGARYDDPLAEDDLDTLGAGLPSNSRSNGRFPGPPFGGSGNGPFGGFGNSGNPFGF